jgi:hypothetical protein
MAMALAALVAAGCAGEVETQPGDTTRVPEGAASTWIPSDGNYYLTSFGGPGDGQHMACGQDCNNGSWYYAADRQRYGCGAHIQIEGNGRCVVAETDDYGPATWVETDAGGPIIDASPLVAQALFGVGGSGWSDHRQVHVTVVAPNTPLGPCGESCDQACGHYGCACVAGQCNGGWCPGTGCTAQEETDCAHFGTSCVDHQCNGGWAPGSGCTPLETSNCSKFGTSCVDHQCAGGWAPGSGCTPLEESNCGKFGCGCVDHKCNGGACQGTGCTALETSNCGKFGCGCTDGKCAGGACGGSDCTWLETSNCGKFGCGCSNHQCHGGACG